MGVGPMSRAWRIAAATASAVAATVYWFVVRPWHRRWGATHGEVHERLPGDDLVPDADEITRAITIDAPAGEVWPWLVQLGQGRGGFYSYDFLENLVGADIHNADRILPEFQDLEVGDTVRLAPADYVLQSPDSALDVAVLDDEQALVIRSPYEPPNFSWAFVLEPVDEGTTRFIVRSRGREPESALSWVGNRLLLEPIHFVMERRMLQGIKKRAEKTSERQREVEGLQVGPAI